MALVLCSIQVERGHACVRRPYLANGGRLESYFDGETDRLCRLEKSLGVSAGLVRNITDLPVVGLLPLGCAKTRPGPSHGVLKCKLKMQTHSSSRVPAVLMTTCCCCFVRPPAHSSLKRNGKGTGVPGHLSRLVAVFRLLEQSLSGDAAQLLGRARVRSGDALRERRGRRGGLDVHDRCRADGRRQGAGSFLAFFRASSSC